MKLQELIDSTNHVKNRNQSMVFQKKFGSIYTFNKNITLAKGGNVVIVNMIIGGATDKIKIGERRVPIAYHKVSLALNVGKEGRKDYTSDELVSLIRLKHKEYSNEEEWPKADVLAAVLNAPDKFFDDATVFQTTNGEGWTVLTNNIPAESEVQVWCSCSDYYWTFQYYNINTRNRNGSSINLYGASNYPKTYTYKSDIGKKSKRPMRNPGRLPGMCKHLMLLVAMLMKDEIIKDPKTGLLKAYKANYKEFLKNKEKDRINQYAYEKMLNRYQKQHEIMMEQRNTAHYQRGDKIERRFDPEKGEFKIINESSNGNKFNVLTGEIIRKKKRY